MTHSAEPIVCKSIGFGHGSWATERLTLEKGEKGIIIINMISAEHN